MRRRQVGLLRAHRLNYQPPTPKPYYVLGYVLVTKLARAETKTIDTWVHDWRLQSRRRVKYHVDLLLLHDETLCANAHQKLALPGTMGTIMRGDQTLRLIQLYYNNYPEIARNTQDADGRKARALMWQQITDELNNSYDTNFSIEQYKKKIQNVQCTSRQKIQAGKRNLGVAEFEYLRLFEQERLSSNTNNCDYESSLTRSSSVDIPTNVKVEQMLEQFGIAINPQILQSGALLNSQDAPTFEAGSPSDSDSNTTTNPSIIDNTLPLSKSPSSFSTLPALTNQMDPRQLMFALTQLNQFNQELRNTNNLNSFPNNQLSANLVHSKTVAIDSTIDANDKEKPHQTSPTFKRSIEDNENLMRTFSVKKRRMNGIFGSQSVDEKWKREMFELQQQILENQAKILDYLNQKQQPLHLSSNQVTVDFSTVESKLEKLCESISCLNETLKDGLAPKKLQPAEE